MQVNSFTGQDAPNTPSCQRHRQTYPIYRSVLRHDFCKLHPLHQTLIRVLLLAIPDSTLSTTFCEKYEIILYWASTGLTQLSLSFDPKCRDLSMEIVVCESLSKAV